MSTVTALSSDKEKKRPSVSSKCLLNIRTIVTQNVSSNRNNKSSHFSSSTSIIPPLPLVDSFVSTKELNKHSNGTKEFEEKKRTKSQILPNGNVISKCLPESLNKQLSTNNEHDRLNIEDGENTSPQISSDDKEHEKVQPNLSSNISKVSDLEPCSTKKPLFVNHNESSIIPPLPLNHSMHSFNRSPSSHRIKPLLSFPAQSSNRINEDYLRQMRQIIESSSSSSSPPPPLSASDETKPIELAIYRHQQPKPIQRFDSASPTISTLDDDEEEEEENDINLIVPLVFVNRSLNSSMNANTSTSISNENISVKSRSSERSEKEYHHQRKLINNTHAHYQVPNARFPTSYARLPHSLQNKNPSLNSPSQPGSMPNSLPIRRQFPQFESIRTPVQRPPTTKKMSLSIIPAEVFDCCQTEALCLTSEVVRTSHHVKQRSSLTTIETRLNESEARSNYFRNTIKIRELMTNVSKRLTQEMDLGVPLPIVDTHCHFDLIFDRLHIKHNNLKKYFHDYNEFYPASLSLQLAIQVFWRPNQLTENDWINWYSKYLDDERVYGACGIHPHWSSAWNETSAKDIERCLEHPKIVAIGEIGLDFGPKNTCLPHEQHRAFEAQLKLAAKWLKPVVIHSRDAFQKTFQLMKQHLQPHHKIHLHCFLGTMDDVHLFTSYFTDIKFGFTPVITRTYSLHTVIQQLELTQILSETDSPYFTPDELSTLTRCTHPGMVYSVVEKIAQIRHLPILDVATQLRENARYIYGV